MRLVFDSLLMVSEVSCALSVWDSVFADCSKKPLASVIENPGIEVLEPEVPEIEVVEPEVLEIEALELKVLGTEVLEIEALELKASVMNALGFELLGV